MSDKGVCRMAPATPGLLIKDEQGNESAQEMERIQQHCNFLSNHEDYLI